MENKVVDEMIKKRINWNEYAVDENGFLVRRQDGVVEGQYLYEDEDIIYTSVADAIKATLRIAF